jgi:hypothetical protein
VWLALPRVALACPLPGRRPAGIPFRDPDGKNPFADPEAEQSSGSENPYAVFAEAKPQDYQPEGYVVSQRGRGRLLLTMSVWGFLATGLAAGTILTTSLISAIMRSAVS